MRIGPLDTPVGYCDRWQAGTHVIFAARRASSAWGGQRMDSGLPRSDIVGGVGMVVERTNGAPRLNRTALKPQLMRQIPPGRVILFDQPHLPRPLPVLDALLALDG